MRLSVTEGDQRAVTKVKFFIGYQESPHFHSMKSLTQSFFRSVLAGAMMLISQLAMINSAGAASLPSGFSQTMIANGLSSPTAMEFAPDGRLFVCLQAGHLRV